MVKKRWLTREIVVEKAVALVDGAGSADSLSLTALAAALDIRVPSLYNHIDSLDDLQSALAVYGARELIHRLRAAIAGRAGRDALVSIALAYRLFAQEHPGIYLLTIRAPDPDDRALSATGEELVQLLMLVLGSIGFHGEEALHMVRGFRALLHGFVALEAADGFRMALDRDESYLLLVNTYLAGLNSQFHARAESKSERGSE